MAEQKSEQMPIPIIRVRRSHLREEIISLIELLLNDIDNCPAKELTPIKLGELLAEASIALRLARLTHKSVLAIQAKKIKNDLENLKRQYENKNNELLEVIAMEVNRL